MRRQATISIESNGTRFYWVLFDRTGRRLAVSRSYASRAGCRHALADVCRLWWPEATLGRPLRLPRYVRSRSDGHLEYSDSPEGPFRAV